MAKVEAPEEVARGTQQALSAQVLIGIPGPVDLGQLQLLTAVMAGQQNAAERGIVVAYPSLSGVSNGVAAEPEAAIRLLPYELKAPPNAAIPWLPHASAYDALFQLTQQTNARACVVLNPDLKAFQPGAIENLLTPVLGNVCDLVMPIYPVDRLEGLLNFGILEPLSRALYGRDVRFPLAPDFAVSAGFALLLSQRTTGRRDAGGSALLWPAEEAAARDRRIWETHIDVHHELSAEGVDLSAILGEVVGPLFSDMERYASVWQRVRGSQPMTVSGTRPEPRGSGRSVDPRPMVEAFQLGYRNLQEVWSMVLPPVTLLQLKAISRQAAESFRMPDQLWAKVVYDFALAHRLRTIGRNHLLGALTPLYLGWVASYVSEVAPLSEDEAEARRERLQRAFEETKPYLLQRWRWPDRFNP